MDITLPPLKRRRRGRKDRPLVEGDPEAVDVVTIEEREVSTRRGKVIKEVLVPLESIVPDKIPNTSAHPYNADLGGFRYELDHLPDHSHDSSVPNKVFPEHVVVIRALK